MKTVHYNRHAIRRCLAALVFVTFVTMTLASSAAPCGMADMSVDLPHSGCPALELPAGLQNPPVVKAACPDCNVSGSAINLNYSTVLPAKIPGSNHLPVLLAGDILQFVPASLQVLAHNEPVAYLSVHSTLLFCLLLI